MYRYCSLLNSITLEITFVTHPSSPYPDYTFSSDISYLSQDLSRFREISAILSYKSFLPLIFVSSLDIIWHSSLEWDGGVGWDKEKWGSLMAGNNLLKRNDNPDENIWLHLLCSFISLITWGWRNFYCSITFHCPYTHSIAFHRLLTCFCYKCSNLLCKCPGTACMEWSNKSMGYGWIIN